MPKNINTAFPDSLIILAQGFLRPVQDPLLSSAACSPQSGSEGKGVGERQSPEPQMEHLLWAIHAADHARSHPPLNLHRPFARFTKEKTEFPRGWMICTKIVTGRIKSHTHILMTSNDSIPRKQPAASKLSYVIWKSLCFPGLPQPSSPSSPFRLIHSNSPTSNRFHHSIKYLSQPLHPFLSWWKELTTCVHDIVPLPS